MGRRRVRMGTVVRRRVVWLLLVLLADLNRRRGLVSSLDQRRGCVVVLAVLVLVVGNLKD